MPKDVRIIDGRLKIVKITQEGKITEIVGDYKKIKEYLKIVRGYEDSQDKKEYIHEINYGKRGKYQHDEKVNEMNEYKKNVLKRKADDGIITKDILELKSSIQLLNNWAREKGYNNYEEYLNIIALGRGFTCYEEYEKVWMYYPGMTSPIKENRKNSRFLGMYIAENAVVRLFGGSQKMPYANIGYDIICPKGHMIDVKATVLSKYNTFNFHVSRNIIADYFVLVAFDNIIELKPLHLWIIKGDEDIYGCPMRDLNVLSILNEPYYLTIYQKYEKTDKLDKLKNICENFNTKNKVDIDEYNTPSKHLILSIITQLRSERIDEILPTDILHIIEKKKKETISNRIPIILEEDCNTKGTR